MKLDKDHWGRMKFSWFYAILMAATIVVLSFIVLYFNIVETSNIRIVYMVVMLGGTLLYSWDMSRHRSERIGFVKGFVHCARTGIYTCIALAPAILVVLMIGLPQLGMVDETGKLDESDYQVGFMGARFLEISASIIISSFLGALLPGAIQGRKTVQE